MQSGYFTSSKAWTREDSNEHGTIEMRCYLPGWDSASFADAGFGVLLRRELYNSARQNRVRAAARAGAAALQYQSRCKTWGANRRDHERRRVSDTTFRVRAGLPAQGRSEADPGPTGRERQ